MDSEFTTPGMVRGWFGIDSYWRALKRGYGSYFSHQWGFRDSRSRLECAALVEDRERPIESLADFDPGTSKRAVTIAGQDLQSMRSNTDYIIEAHCSVIFEAEMMVRIGWYGSESGARFPGGYRKLPVMLREISPQDVVGCLHRIGTRQAEFTYQPVLEGTPQTFYAPSGLGRARPYRGNAQLFQKPAELGMMLLTFQLLLDGCLFTVSRLEDRVPVMIKGMRQTGFSHDMLQELKIPLRVFLFTEKGISHLTRGIIYSPNQGHLRSPPLQPVVMAGINLQEHALLGKPLSAGAVSGSMPPARTLDTSIQEYTSHRRARKTNLLTLCQVLGEMLGVEANVLSLGQIQNTLFHLVIYDMGWSLRPRFPCASAAAPFSLYAARSLL